MWKKFCNGRRNAASASCSTLNLPALNHADRRVSDCQGSHPAWVRPATQQHLLWHLSVDGAEIGEFVSYRFGSVRFGSDRLEIRISECRSGCFMGLSERSMHKFVSY